MALDHQNSPLSQFMYCLRASETRRQWPQRLKMLFDFLKIEGDLDHQATTFAENSKKDPKWGEESLMRFISFQNERVKCGEISPSTVSNYFKPAKLFCEMNELVFNWNKIRRGLPVARKAANDRAPTSEEIKKLADYPDRRIKPIVYTMISSGIRIGAWDFLRWKHIVPIRDGDNNVIAAKVIVYGGEPEELLLYYTGGVRNGWNFANLMARKLLANLGLCVIYGRQQMLHASQDLVLLPVPRNLRVVVLRD
jgi:hypothetical protein